MDEELVHPPFLPWRADWKLRASAWSSPTLTGPATVFRTLESAGDIAPDEAPPAWSFHLGIPENLGIPDVAMLSNGFSMRFSELTEDSQVHCYLAARHVMVGEADFALHSSLFSPQHEVREATDEAMIEIPGGTVLLRRKQSDAASTFWLCVHPDGEEAARDAIAAAQAFSPRSQAHEEWRLRSDFWSCQEGIGEDVGLLSPILEQLVYPLECPEGVFAMRWSAASATRPEFDLRQLFPLVKAWSTIDNGIARELARTAVSLIRNDGLLPATIDPQGQANTTDVAWPMLVQSCAAAWDGADDATVIRDALPHLLRYIQASQGVYDESGIGIPCWPTAASSLIPDTYDEDLASAALAGFLLAEIDAFTTLVEQVESKDVDPAVLTATREQLISHLRDTFWDAESGVFRDRYVAGAAISRITLSGIMPLMWGDLPEEFKNPLIEKSSDPALFGKPGGAPMWVEWENDPSPPPVPPAHQVLLLAALRHHSLEKAEMLQRQVATAYIRLRSVASPLPLDLRAGGEPGNNWYDVPVMSACLGLLALPMALRNMGTQAVSDVLLRLDRHRFTIMSAVVAVVAIAVLVPSLALVSREPRRSRSAAASSLARHYMALKKYDQALEILDNVDTTRVTPDIVFLRANLNFRMGNFAEARLLYQKSIDSGVSVAKSSMNLALSLYKEKQYDAAVERYSQVIDTYGELYPELGNMARLARDLVQTEQQWLATDDETAPEE